MKMQRGLITVLIAVLFVFGMAGSALAAWGTKGVVIGLGVAVCAFLLTGALRRLYRKIGI